MRSTSSSSRASTGSETSKHRPAALNNRLTISFFLLTPSPPYVHVRLSSDVEGVDPVAAARWWGDFREGHTDHRFFPGSSRSIVERGPTHVTLQESVAGLPWESVTAWPGERGVRFVGRNHASTFEGQYTFEAMSDGTRIHLDATIELRKSVRWADAIARPAVVALLRADLKGHAKEMARDLRM